LASWLLGKTPLTEPVLADAPKTDPLAISTSFDSLSQTEIREASGRMNTSCLLVNGQNDPAVSPPDLDQIVSVSEWTHTVSFEQSGHFPMLDESSKFNRLMIDFLSLPSG